MKNQDRQTVTQAVFLDCETRPASAPGPLGAEDHRLWFGSAQYRRFDGDGFRGVKWLTFHESCQLWEWVWNTAQLDRPLWLFAHNAGFDLRASGFFLQCDKGEISFDAVSLGGRKAKNGNPLVVLEDPPIIVVCWLKSRLKLIIVDTYNYFRCSVKELGQSVGLQKFDMPDRRDRFANWERYCKRDVEIIATAVTKLLKWLRSHGTTTVGYSAAGCSWLLYKQHYETHKVVQHNQEHVLDLERKALYTGQSQVFREGEIEGPIYHYDVRSFYPYIMRENKFPVELLSYYDQDETPTQLEADDLSDCIATVQIQCRGSGFPHRTKRGILYDPGSYTTTLAGPELVRAAKVGAIQRIGSIARYRMEPIFVRFVDTIWAIRKKAIEENDGAFSLFCKLILNSLYGKFGQRNTDWKRVDLTIPIDEWGRWNVFDRTSGEIKEYRSIAGNVWQDCGRVYTKNAFPAICSFVTSYGREYMRLLRERIGHDNCYYQGVDSLFVNERGNKNCAGIDGQSEPILGKLRCVASYDGAAFRCNGCYRIGNRIVESGLKGNAVHIGGGIYRQEEFESLPVSLQNLRLDTIRIRIRNYAIPTKSRKD